MWSFCAQQGTLRELPINVIFRNFANGPDNEIYCLFCYERIHGKKAKTKSMPLDTTSIPGEGELGTCPR